MANRLARESSPYLLQHADNPVDWYPWGEEAFARARPSSGRSFCRSATRRATGATSWRTSRSRTSSVAPALNDGFVSIKVDREERPDVDRVYMAFVQATTGCRRLADERVADAGSEAVLRRHLFSADVALGPAGLRRRPDRARARLARRAAARRRLGRRADGAPARRRRVAAADERRMRAAGVGAGHRGARRRRERRSVRPSTRASAASATRRSSRGRRSSCSCCARAARAGADDLRDDGRGHAAGDGARRHARPSRRRLPSLFGRRALARAALREDALRPGPAGARVPRGRAGDAATRSTRRWPRTRWTTCGAI